MPLAEKAVSRTVLLESGEEALQLFGKHDRYFDLIEDNFRVRLLPRDFELVIEGPEEEVEPLYQMFQELLRSIRRGAHTVEPRI